MNDREPETGINVPHVPLTSATTTKDATGNVIDLAKLPDATGKDPP
jgi:hypothetical protein